MNVYKIEVKINGWRYNSVAGDIERATMDALLAVEKFGEGENEWEMHISMVNEL